MMGLDKYKICPACGEHNAPNLLECRKCATDLTGIKIIDSLLELPTSHENNSDVQELEELYRLCDCGELNHSQTRKCQACGEDISDILPEKHAISQTNNFSYTLQSFDGCFSCEFEQPVVIIGREAMMSDYLREKTYVSRKQAKLTIVDGKVFIENLSKTNKTFVNNNALDDGKPLALCDGDEIGLGGKIINEERQNQAVYLIFRSRT